MLGGQGVAVGGGGGPGPVVIGLLPTTWRIPGQYLDSVALAIDTVRYVGQPIGVVIARSRAVAEDLAELVEIDPLPAVVGVEAALAPDAPLLYPEHGSDVAGGIHFGPPVEALDACSPTPRTSWSASSPCNGSIPARWSRAACSRNGSPAPSS